MKSEPSGEGTPRKRKADAMDDEEPEPTGDDIKEDSCEEANNVTQQPNSTEFAVCPFTVELVRPLKSYSSKRRKSTSTDDKYGPELEDKLGKMMNVNLDIGYIIRPGQSWTDMTNYRNFIVVESKFSLYDTIFINNSHEPQNTLLDPLSKLWIAYVLEVKASSPQHVYLRVFWLYWPDELPMGRQSYHGKNELVMSNHMEIVDAMTVTGKADVRQWTEKDEEEDVGALFWRQEYHVLSGKLSGIRKHCICDTYYNPDKTLLSCPHKGCQIWMHEECVIDDILRRTYSRLIPEDASALKKEKKKSPVAAKSPGSKKKSATIEASPDLQQQQPWDGKFKAEIPTVDGKSGKVIITDTRGQDEETWTEDVLCLKCQRALD